ncbi:hypothetical protein ACFSUK_13445 [Sphingobium scionense]
MTRPHSPMPGELPTLGQLNRATLIAFGAAAVILVTTVLPAEYGVDPTGVGGALGLTPMGEMKQAEHDAAPVASSAQATPTASKLTVAAPGEPVQVVITLKPNEGREIKAVMTAGSAMRYAWKTDGAKIRYELHGEEFNAPEGEYTSYEKGTPTGESGSFTAPFDGTHGWYWKNKTSEPVTITASATGGFSAFAAKP